MKLSKILFLLNLAVLAAGPIVAQEGHGDNIPSACLGDLRLLVRMHAQDAANAFGLAYPRVQYGRSRLNAARIEPHESKRAIAARLQLRHDGRQRSSIRRRPRDGVTRARIGAGYRRPVQRRRAIVRHGVQQRLHTDIAVGRTAQDRCKPALDGAFADQSLQIRCIERILVLHPLGQRRVAGFRKLFHELAAPGFCFPAQGFRHAARGWRNVLRAPGQRLHRDKVDHAAELPLLAERELQHQRNSS